MHASPLRNPFFVSTLALSCVLLLAQSGHSNTTFPRDSPNIQSLKASLSQIKSLADRGRYDVVLQLAPALSRRLEREDRPDLDVQLGRLVGAANLGLDRYREALRVMLPAREKAAALRDNRSLYSLDSNLASVYIQMNNLESAATFADEALLATRASGAYSPRPLMVRAYIYANLAQPDLPRAEELDSQAISEAMEAGDLDSAAAGWQYLGQAYLAAGRFAPAEEALSEALRLAELRRLPGRDTVLRDLADVMASTGRLDAATVLMDQALTAAQDQTVDDSPLWSIFEHRGRLRILQGDANGALSDFRSSLELVRRRKIIPTDDDRVAFESGVANLYSEFIDAATVAYLKSRDPRLRREVFQAAEENRAASLRALVPQPGGWRTRLPAEHQVILAKLQSAERANRAHDDPRLALQIRQFRERLHDIESRAGIDSGLDSRSAWDLALRALDGDTAILSFHLGRERSWIWSVTQDTFEVRELPSRRELARQSRAFRDVVRSSSGNIGEAGDRLGQALLGSVGAKARAKRRWIVVLDQDLFGLPLSALRLDGRYLVEDHALLVTPGIQLLEPAGSTPHYDGEMAGLGDAIYNGADSRVPNGHSWIARARKFLGWDSGNRTNHLNLARLSGSGDEVRAAVRIWGRGSVATGMDVTKANLDRALAKNPAILHLATHVVKTQQYDSGVIVLGLDTRGELEFLDMRDILLKPVKTRLVVMSGCASGDAQALPASGLMGLTRAWIGAGAGEVMATMWPALDDSGPFFQTFYRNLRRNPNLGAAEALRQAQVEMLHSGSFRGKPEYWASYFLVGKV